MLKNKFKLATILFIILVLISSICFATTEPSTTDENVSLISEEATNEDEHDHEADSTNDWLSTDLFKFEEDVVVNEIVDGNAFIIGKNVTIKGEIGGDLFVIADKLTIDDGYIYSSIFACANEISVNGIVYDMYALSNNFTINESGFIYRDAKIFANSININGKIKRNAYLDANSYNFSEEATIGGNVEYSASEDITIPEGVVSGEVTRNESKEISEVENISDTILSYITDLVKTLAYTFVVLLLLLWLTPKFISKLSDVNVSKGFIALGIGLATFASILVGSILLLFTVIGVPIAISALVLLTILACISFSVTSIFFGKLFSKLLKLEGNVKFTLITLASSIALWILTKIPFLGGFVTVLITLFGVGLVTVNVFSKEKKENN